MVKNSGFQLEGERAAGEVIGSEGAIHGSGLVGEIGVGDGDYNPGQTGGGQMPDALAPSERGSGSALYEERYVRSKFRADMSELVVGQFEAPEPVESDEGCGGIRAPTAQAGGNGNALLYVYQRAIV